MVRTLAIRAALLAIGSIIVPVSANAAPARVHPSFGSAPLVTAHPSAGFMSSDAAGKNAPVLFVSDAVNNAVYLFAAKHVELGPVGEITSGIDSPAGLAVDGKGILYVANTNASTITEYKPGATRAFATISGFSYPEAIAVSSDGTLVVASGTTYEAPGKLAVYAPGASAPERTITIPLNGNYYMVMGGVAISDKHEIYLSFAREGSEVTYQVVKFSKKSSTPISTGISGGARGLALDGKGNLYVGYATSIEVYAKGAKQPSSTISSSLTSVGLFSVSSMGQLFVPNQETSNGCQGVDGNVVTFSRNFQSDGTVSSGMIDPLGTAYRPGAK